MGLWRVSLRVTSRLQHRSKCSLPSATLLRLLSLPPSPLSCPLACSAPAAGAKTTDLAHAALSSIGEFAARLGVYVGTAAELLAGRAALEDARAPRGWLDDVWASITDAWDFVVGAWDTLSDAVRAAIDWASDNVDYWKCVADCVAYQPLDQQLVCITGCNSAFE